MMGYKGMQLPLNTYDENGNFVKELYTIAGVTFDPCVVTFENGVVIPWDHTKEEFDIYVESLQLPTVSDYLLATLKGKKVLINKIWWEIVNIGKFLVKIRVDNEEKEYLMEDLFTYRIK
jgi:hypothetical protein